MARMKSISAIETELKKLKDDLKRPRKKWISFRIGPPKVATTKQEY